MGLVTIINIHCTYIHYLVMCVFHLPLHVLFLSFFIHMVLITCMQSIISVSHKDALIGFV